MSDAVKDKVIEIIDRGRGPQLSTSRITVMDLVPYFLRGASHDEIGYWIPSLSPEQIAVVKRYYLEHRQQCDEQDRELRQYREEQIRLQHLRFPEIEETTEECLVRLKKLALERNGERHSG